MQFAVLSGMWNNVILQNIILGSKNKLETWQIRPKNGTCCIAGSILADINSSWIIITGIRSDWLQVNECVV